MDRTELVNGLIDRRGYKRYLEIGVKKGACFGSIRVASKTGVDPDMSALKPRYERGILRRYLRNRRQGFWRFEGSRESLYEMTSDDFFSAFDDLFDIVFVDGLHQFDQVLRDYAHAQARLTPDGCVVLHDCNPLTEEAAERHRPPDVRVWNGDTWKAVYHLRRMGQRIDVFDFDHGCGVAPKQQLPESLWTTRDIRELENLPFEKLSSDRAGAVGLVAWEGFGKIASSHS